MRRAWSGAKVRGPTVGDGLRCSVQVIRVRARSRFQSSARIMHMHRFTDPTPASFTARTRIDLAIAGWEIECCAPPPVVGQDTTWALKFCPPNSTSSDIPAWMPERDWELTELAGVGPVVSDGVITASWVGEDPVPPLGRVRTGGCLWGTVHTASATLPRYTGRVQQIRVVSHRYISDEHGFRAVPGTLTLTDVTESPRWFDFSRPPEHDTPDNPPQRDALLLTMTIAAPQRPE